MRFFSAHYIITGCNQLLRRGIITADDDGTIISVEDNRGLLRETRSVEFFNGIIVPGFVNCHCHLELSHLKGAVPAGKGLGAFLMNIRNLREQDTGSIISAALAADDEMYNEGVNLCADVCNNSSTFDIKKTSRIRYLNLLEVFGIDPGKAGKRMKELSDLADEAEKNGLPYYLVPHTVYSVSLPLFRLLKKQSGRNKVTSIHFMESEGESAFLEQHSGPLRKLYEESGLLPPVLQMPEDHISAILEEVTTAGNLILVHNTFADKKIVSKIKKRGNTYWCLCPDSNIYIEDKLPPAEMLISEDCEIVIGTDSLASNRKLSILSALKTLQKASPGISLDSLIRWSTINGAKALGEEKNYGSIEAGKKPGLLLLEDADLINFRLLPETRVKRLL